MNIFILDPGRYAEGAGCQRSQPRGDSGQNSAAAEGDGRGQLARLHQQDSEECSQRSEPQQRRSGQGEKSSHCILYCIYFLDSHILSFIVSLNFPIIRQN